MLKGKSVDFKNVITEVIKLSDAFYAKKNLQEYKSNITDPFILEAVELYIDELVDDDKFIKMLKDRVNNMKKSLMMDVNRFKNIGKYPPAFGMMGTTMGMVVFLRSWRKGRNEDQASDGGLSYYDFIRSYYC